MAFSATTAPALPAHLLWADWLFGAVCGASDKGAEPHAVLAGKQGTPSA